jgi:general secretion pathway protein C
MVRMLNKHFWIIHLIFIAAVAWLAAHLSVVVLQDRMISSPSSSPAGNLPPVQAERQEPYDRYAPVTANNIFNPGEKGLKLLPLDEIKPTVTSASGREDAESAKPTAPKKYKLVGTITGPGDRSYAFIQEGTDPKQKIYRFHEDIDGGKIVKISRDHIVIRRQKEEEVISFISKEVGSQPVKGPQPPPRSATGETVRRMSSNRFLINREDATASVGDVNKFMTQARMKPHFEMGKPSGYSVSEIIPGSLIEKIGLRNNDIIKKVNGQMINKPEEVYQAYAQLLKDANIEVEIERGGRSEVFRYEIK